MNPWPVHPDNWRALTVRRPWSWCIWTGDKLVENRTAAWRYRGPLMVHAGVQWSERGAADPLVREVWRRQFPQDPAPLVGPRDPTAGFGDPGLMAAGHVGAVCWVEDVHPHGPGCCDSPWAEDRYLEAGGKVRTNVHHLVLADVVRLPSPVPARGRLGLWRPDPDLVAAVVAGLRAVA